MFRYVFRFTFLLSVALILFAGILAARGYWVHRHQRKLFTGPPLFISDPQMGYVQAPNRASTYQGKPPFHVFTDSQGARVTREGEVLSNVGLLGVGGSFVWGQGVEQGETFSHRLARYLEVSERNYGTPGYGTTTSLIRLREALKHNKPKWVVYGLIKDHIRRSVFPCAPTSLPFCRSVPRSELDSNGNLHHVLPSSSADYNGFLGSMIYDRSFHLADIRWALKADWVRFIGDSGARQNAVFEAAVENGEARKVVVKLIAEMEALANAHGARFIVTYIPNPDRLEGMPVLMKDEIRYVFKSRSSLLVDLSGRFENYADEYGTESLKVASYDAHPSVEGHRLIANAICREIQNCFPRLDPVEPQKIARSDGAPR